MTYLLMIVIIDSPAACIDAQEPTKCLFGSPTGNSHLSCSKANPYLFTIATLKPLSIIDTTIHSVAQTRKLSMILNNISSFSSSIQANSSADCTSYLLKLSFLYFRIHFTITSCLDYNFGVLNDLSASTPFSPINSSV